MGSDLKQGRGTQTAPEPLVTEEQAKRGNIWPYLVTGIAVVALAVAGMLFVTQDPGVPFRSDVSVIEDSTAAVHEKGPYAGQQVEPVQVEDLAVGVEDLMTEAREGGTYSETSTTDTETTEDYRYAATREQ